MFPHASHGLYSVSHSARGHNSHQEAVVAVVLLLCHFRIGDVGMLIT